MMMADGPLHAVAADFVVPAKSGVYLTKSEIIVLAHLSEGSLRINERYRMLVDVLVSPSSREGLRALLQRLIRFCLAHVEHYDELQASFPQLAGHLAPWRERATRTVDRLQELEMELDE